MTNDTDAINNAMEIIEKYGAIDGNHHKTWVIDQIARALMREDYEGWAEEMRYGEDGPDTYEWDKGIAP